MRGSASLAIAPALGLTRTADADRITASARQLAGTGGKTLRLLLPRGSAANVSPVARLFEEQSGVRLSLREVAVDAVASTASLASVAGRPDFDIALPATFAIPDLVEGGMLLPLDDYVAKHEPPGLATGSLYRHGDRYKGRFYGYQTDGDVYLMFYNRDLLEDPALKSVYEDRAGRPLGVPTSWEELDGQLEFFSNSSDDRYGGTLFRIPGYVEWEWWLRLHAKGALPVDDEMNAQFHLEEGVAALEDLVRASAWLSPGSKAQGLFENWADFANGNTFCNLGWGGTQKYLRGPNSSLRDKLVIGPTPGGKRGELTCPISYFNWGWNYVISKHAEEPELAYLFTLFASLPEPSTLSVRARDGFFDPHRTEHYADDQVVDTYSQPFLHQHRASLANCIPDFYLQGRDEYFALLGLYVDRANRGELDPERALLLASRGWELITDRLGRDKQIEQWRNLKAAYPPQVLDFTSAD